MLLQSGLQQINDCEWQTELAVKKSSEAQRKGLAMVHLFDFGAASRSLDDVAEEKNKRIEGARVSRVEGGELRHEGEVRGPGGDDDSHGRGDIGTRKLEIIRGPPHEVQRGTEQRRDLEPGCFRSGQLHKQLDKAL